MNVVYLGSLARDHVTQTLADSPFNVIAADTDADLARVIPEADVLVTAGPWYTQRVAALTHTAKHLQLIQLTSAGFENVERFGVPPGTQVCNAADAWSIAVAEHAMAMLLALGRRISDALDLQRQCHWRRAYTDQCRSLYGKTLVIVGYGRIGKQIAQRAKAFAMVVVAVKTRAVADAVADEVLGMDQLRHALARADVVVAAVPSSTQTVGMFHTETFAQMKPDALFINVARGDVVNTPDLLVALRSGQLSGAALDVTDPEPLPPDAPLWTAPNLLITPHVAGAVPDLVPHSICNVVVENLRRLAQRAPLQHVVSLSTIPPE